MPRATFERQLARLEEALLILVSMVEHVLEESIHVLQRRDMEGARRLVAGDRMLNERRYAVEAEALALIATQQPTARDLRTLAVVLEIASELERIGDYAKGTPRASTL